MTSERQIDSINDLDLELEKRITASEQLLGICKNILKDEHQDEISTVNEWVSKCRAVLKNPERVSVALLGGTGAGKSTLVNALIGAVVLPTNSISVCTSSITRVRYRSGANYSATIEVVPRETWQKQVETISEDIKASKQGDSDESSYVNIAVVPEDEAGRIRAVYGNEQYEEFAKNGDISLLSEPIEIRSAFEKRKIKVSYSNTDDLRKEISRYLTSKESFWPIVQSCTIEGPFEGFDHGGEIVDLPGLNDPNEAREELTKKFLESSKFVWVVFNMKRSLGKELTQVLESRDLLNRLMAGGRISTLTFVGTHSDDISTVSPSDIGLEDDDDVSNADVALRRNFLAEEELRTNLRNVARTIATAGDDSPESKAIIESLVSSPNFMVSASNYLQLRGASKKRVAAIFDNEIDTQIPNLASHMKNLCVEAGPKANAFTLVSSLEEIVAELAAIAQQVKAEQILSKQSGKISQKILAEGVAKAETDLKGNTAKIIEKLKRSLQNAVGRFEKGTAIDKVVVGNIVAKTTSSWSSMHWATLRATTARGGRYVSSSKGEIDLIKQLSDPVIRNSMKPWTDFFEKDLPAITNDANESLRVALTEYSNALMAFGGQSPEIELLLNQLLPELVGDVTESIDAALLVAQKAVEADLLKRQQELHRITEGAIADAMAGVFAKAASERGTGMKVRMNSHLDFGSRAAVNNACDLVQKNLAVTAAKSIAAVLGEVVPASEKIEGKSSRITKTLSETKVKRSLITDEGIENLQKAVDAARKIVNTPIEFVSGALKNESALLLTEEIEGTIPGLEASAPPVFVDASNIARNVGGAPNIDQLEKARVALVQKFPSHSVILIADASLSRLAQQECGSTDLELFKAMLANQHLVLVPPGTPGKADKFILNLASAKQGIVVSNDSFREFQQDHIWLFEEGRLYGHAFIESLGWQFTIRFPVRPRT